MLAHLIVALSPSPPLSLPSPASLFPHLCLTPQISLPLSLIIYRTILALSVRIIVGPPSAISGKLGVGVFRHPCLRVDIGMAECRGALWLCLPLHGPSQLQWMETPSEV